MATWWNHFQLWQASNAYEMKPASHISQDIFLNFTYIPLRIIDPSKSLTIALLCTQSHCLCHMIKTSNDKSLMTYCTSTVMATTLDNIIFMESHPPFKSICHTTTNSLIHSFPLNLILQSFYMKLTILDHRISPHTHVLFRLLQGRRK